MSDETIPRRKFLLGAGLSGTAVATGLAPDAPAQAQDLATTDAIAAADTQDATPRRFRSWAVPRDRA